MSEKFEDRFKGKTTKMDRTGLAVLNKGAPAVSRESPVARYSTQDRPAISAPLAVAGTIKSYSQVGIFKQRRRSRSQVLHNRALRAV